jgi:nucleotide-binding universal stress UspA family protein
MNSLEHILVAVDSEQPDSPELQRALAIARYSGASLHIVDVIRDLNMAARLMPSWQAAHEKLGQEKLTALKALADRYEGQGITTSHELLHGEYSQALLKVIEERQIDLLVRSAKGARSAESGAIGATSNQLLRRAPCALWLTQGEDPSQCQRIVAAIDATPDDAAHAALNRVILSRSLELVEREGCRLDVVYVWNILDAELLQDRVPKSDLDEMIERNQACHVEAYERVLSEFDLHASDENVHLIRGEPTQVIPEFCQTHRSDLLVCGTVARRGISGLMIGNTANRMLQKIPCSILALR